MRDEHEDAVNPSALAEDETGDFTDKTEANDNTEVNQQVAALPSVGTPPRQERVPIKPATAKVLLLHVGASIRALDDLDGRKVIVEDLDPHLAHVVSATFQSLGINPVLVPSPEASNSAERLQSGEVGATLAMVDADKARLTDDKMMRIAVDPWLSRE